MIHVDGAPADVWATPPMTAPPAIATIAAAFRLCAANLFITSSWSPEDVRPRLVSRTGRVTLWFPVRREIVVDRDRRLNLFARPRVSWGTRRCGPGLADPGRSVDEREPAFVGRPHFRRCAGRRIVARATSTYIRGHDRGDHFGGGCTAAPTSGTWSVRRCGRIGSASGAWRARRSSSSAPSRRSMHWRRFW